MYDDSNAFQILAIPTDGCVCSKVERLSLFFDGVCFQMKEMQQPHAAASHNIKNHVHSFNNRADNGKGNNMNEFLEAYGGNQPTTTTNHATVVRSQVQL